MRLIILTDTLTLTLYIHATRVGNLMSVEFYYGNKSVSHQTCLLDGSDIHLESGRTNFNQRRKGYGTNIRAIILWCAKRAGYKKAHQISMFMTNSNTSRHRPPSAYIMNRLGFKHQVSGGIRSANSNSNNNTTSEYRELNLVGRIPGVNRVISQLHS